MFATGDSTTYHNPSMSHPNSWDPHQGFSCHACVCVEGIFSKVKVTKPRQSNTTIGQVHVWLDLYLKFTTKSVTESQLFIHLSNHYIYFLMFDLNHSYHHCSAHYFSRGRSAATHNISYCLKKLFIQHPKQLCVNIQSWRWCIRIDRGHVKLMTRRHEDAYRVMAELTY